MTLAIPINVDFSPEGIRRLREGLGLTRAEFANSLGVSRKTVWQWEMGLVSPVTSYCREQLRQAQEELLRRQQ